VAYCKYHPLVAATYTCPHCSLNNCDQCSGERDRHGNTLCHFCAQPLESLGTSGSAEPFWRRLQEAFRYPLNRNALPVIIGISAFTTFLWATPLLGIITFIIYLALIGAMLKYCFRCLEHTAEGEMSAPDIGDAYQSGLGLLLKLFLMFIITTFAIGAVGAYVGTAIAGLLGILTLVMLPAVIIRFAQSDEIFDSLNPIAALQLILAIGLPYGLLIVFMMIMMGSVGVIQQLIGDHFSIISHVLQAIASNYYLVVVFHLMGYMLFQYQEKIGYSARADNITTTRSDEDIHAAKIDVNVKEGNYNTAVKLFEDALKKFPNTPLFYQQFFDFSCNTKNKPLIRESTNHYLNWLYKNREYEKIVAAFATATRQCPDFIPDNPGARLHLAKNCATKGIPATTVKLVNGMHKSFPNFEGLAEAYNLLANALDELNKHPQAAKCRLMVEQLKKRTPKAPTQKPAANPFAAKDIPPLAAGKAENSDQVLAQPTSVETGDQPKDLPPIEFK